MSWRKRIGSSSGIAMVIVGVASACSGSTEPAADRVDVSITAPAGENSPASEVDALEGERRDTESSVVAGELVMQYDWTVLSSGAGGFVTGMAVDPQGRTLVARTDVGGAYRWEREEGRWTQLLAADRVESPRRTDYFVESIAVASSDPDRIYLATGDSSDEQDGRLLRSDDRGETWSEAATELVIAGNGDYRSGAERLAVDPSDPDEVWFASRTQGLLVSRDGGETLDPVDGVPTGGDDAVGVTFVLAASNGTTIWAGVAREGVFMSEDDGATWDEVYATDSVPVDADVDALGRLWVVEDDPTALTVVEDGVSRRLEQLSESLAVLGLDPTDPDIAMVGSSGIAGGGLWRTTNGGETWENFDLTTTCPSVPWLDEYPNDYFPAGSLLIDPVDGALWVPEGFGIWREAVPTAPIELECEVTGVEELVSNDIVVPPGGRPVTAHWDRAIFHHGASTASEVTIGPTQRFNSAWDLDWSPADPTMIFAVVADHRFCCESDGAAYASGWSSDGGVTWERFGSYDASHPKDLRFGNIAVSADDVDNLVWLPTFNKALQVSTDRGDTWSEVILPGTEDMVDSEGVYAGGSHFQYFLNRKVLTADRVLPDTFYLYHQELGLFQSTDGGATWSLRESEGLPTGWTVGYFNASLLASPVTPEHLIFAPGALAEETTGLYESFDGGDTWSRIEGMSDVSATTWGAAAPDVELPTLYVAGSLNGQPGVWRRSADDSGWQQVASAPGGNYQPIKALGADLEEFGTVYVGFEGTSFMVGRHAAPS